MKPARSEKARTAYGYTETDDGPIPHLKIVGIFGVKEVVHAPVALQPHGRNSKGLPYPLRHGPGLLVYVLPGGLHITQDGKPLAATR